MSRDPYELLGVKRDATQKEIQSAYRKLAKKLHPDLNPGDKDAERKFKDISAAYGIVGDEDKRGRFDRGEIDATGAEQAPRNFYRDYAGAGAQGSAYHNGGGFANFVMSMKKRRAVLRSPGTYRFSVSVPPGWRVSTGNADQSLQLDELPGSPAGLAGNDLPRAVGLMPARFVRGRTETAAALLVTSNGKVLDERRIAPGDFRFDLPAGADILTISGSGLDRRLALSAYATDLGLLRPGAMAADAVLEPVSLDRVTALPFQKIPSGYGGLAWRNLNVLTSLYVNGSEGYLNGNISRGHVAYTSSGHPAEFSRAAPFGFHSVMLSAAWLASEGEAALVESWLGEELVASDEIALSALAPMHYAPMLKAVTRVRISTRHSWQAVLDELVLAP